MKIKISPTDVAIQLTSGFLSFNIVEIKGKTSQRWEYTCDKESVIAFANDAINNALTIAAENSIDTDVSKVIAIIHERLALALLTEVERKKS